MRSEILAAASVVKTDSASVYDSARVAIDIYNAIESLIRRQRKRRGADSTQLDETATEQTDERGESADQAEGGDIDGDDAQAADEDITGSGVEFRGNLMPDLVHRQIGGGQVGSSQAPDTPGSDSADHSLKPEAANEAASLQSPSTRIAVLKKGLNDGPRSYLYDEWNYLDELYHPAWCRLYEHRLRGDDLEFVGSVRRRHAVLANQVKRQFSFIKPESWQRVYRTSDGDELGLDSLIETVIDRRAGQTSDEHLYVRRDRALREVAAAFLVDMSASTDFPVPDPELAPARRDGSSTGKKPAAEKSPAEYGPYLYGGYDDLLPLTPAAPKRRVIDVAKESLALMCDALQTLGDSYAVYGFSGEGRDNVEFYVAKDFNDRLSARTWGALAAMQPRRSTRMGPAIRHAVTKLAHQPMRLKVLIIVSDGYPQDSDYGPNRSDDEYGIQDTARALREAERAGISTFCITIDPAGHDYLRRMCSVNRYLVIDDVRSLPDELTKVYRALTA